MVRPCGAPHAERLRPQASAALEVVPDGVTNTAWSNLSSDGLPTKSMRRWGTAQSDIAEFRPAIKHAVIPKPEHLRQMILRATSYPETWSSSWRSVTSSTVTPSFYSVWDADASTGSAAPVAREQSGSCRQNAHS